MPQLKLKQLRYESESWKRVVGFIMEENVLLKTRLAEVLKDNFSSMLLTELENFQNRFVKEDDFIRLLRKDIAIVDKLLQEEIFENGQVKTDVKHHLRKVCEEITSAEIDFSRLKSEFNRFLTEQLVV